jgi:ribonuclease BN (tRNA processing enzyme)
MEDKKRNGMEVTFYGTRGSVPIANQASMQTGGNTTCLRINSQCLPEGVWLVVDAGSGFVPLCFDALKAGVKQAQILFTHFHWDHTQGLPLGPLTFIKGIPITCWGTEDEGIGPREVLTASMKRPFFPVDFAEVASHFSFKRIEHPNTQVILIHPEGGIKQMPVDQFESFDGKPLPIGRDKRRYSKSECLVIKMMRSYHRDEKTGIINSKLDGAPDDILSALNQMLYWGNVFWTTAKLKVLYSSRQCAWKSCHFLAISACWFGLRPVAGR